MYSAPRERPFTSWSELTAESPQIVIARGTQLPDPTVSYPDGINADMEVESILKGEVSPPPASAPRLGRTFVAVRMRHGFCVVRDHLLK